MRIFISRLRAHIFNGNRDIPQQFLGPEQTLAGKIAADRLSHCLLKNRAQVGERQVGAVCELGDVKPGIGERILDHLDTVRYNRLLILALPVCCI